VQFISFQVKKEFRKKTFHLITLFSSLKGTLPVMKWLVTLEQEE
jgi:hypothetical protein